MSGINRVVPETLDRKAGLIIAILFIPVIFVWPSSLGLMVFGSCVATSAVAYSYYKYKATRWLWMCITLFITLHFALIFSIRGAFEFRYAISILPIFLLDFIVMSYAVSAIGNRFEADT